MVIIEKKKRTCRIVDFAIPKVHTGNIKEIEKKEQVLIPCLRTKKLCKIKVAVIPVVIGSLGTIPEGLERGLEVLEIGGRVETI